MEYLKKLGLTLLSVVVFFLILELFLRGGGYKIVTFYVLNGFHRYDANLGWVQIPNHEATFEGRDFKVTVKSNSHGFRDREYAVQKPNGITRVMVLGDSFTWGWGVEHEEVFTEVAERALDNVEILNLGHSSYGTAQEYLLLKRLGMKFSPDLTVVTFYSNDIKDNSGRRGKRPKFILNEGRLILDKRPRPLTIDRRLKKILNENFLFYSFIDYRIAVLKQARLDPMTIFGFDTFLFKNFLDEMQDAWDVTQALLLEIDRLTDHRMVILFVPHRLQVEEDRFQQELHAAQLDEHEIDVFLTNRLLKEFSEEHHIPFLDLTPSFRKEHRRAPLYFDHDGHWSPQGHQVAGEAFQEKLKELLSSEISP